MKIDSGIVLKTCSSQAPEITVLDRRLGKIKGKVHARNKNIRVGHGSIVTYTLSQRGASYTFDVVDLEFVPFTFAREDIFFLHHILELCYYFLPMGCPEDDVFNLLLYLFQLQNNEKVRLRRRLILARLFTLFGMYPEHKKMSEYINIVVYQSLDQLLDMSVDIEMNRWLDQWVWECIMAHPYKEQFKTVWLLKRAESHEI